MKIFALSVAALALSATAALAGDKTYQVTGPVLAIDSNSITVEKGSEKWQLARDAKTSLPESVKVGSKVTIQYSMTAVSVEDKTPLQKPDTNAKGASKADTKAPAKK